jgi:hypothetical protein
MTGYISYKGDRDYYVIQKSRRGPVTLFITGVKNGEIRVSVPDPLGYALKSVIIKGDLRVALSEIIEGRGYVVVDSMRDNYEFPYTISSPGDGL